MTLRQGPARCRGKDHAGRGLAPRAACEDLAKIGLVTLDIHLVLRTRPSLELDVVETGVEQEDDPLGLGLIAQASRCLSTLSLSPPLSGMLITSANPFSRSSTYGP